MSDESPYGPSGEPPDGPGGESPYGPGGESPDEKPWRPKLSLRNLRGARRALREVSEVGRIYRGLREQHRKEDPDTPFRVHTDEHTLRVAARATELVEEGREDPEALEELRQLAGHRSIMVRVEEFCRLDGRHLEDRQGNHVHRLVAAALARKPLEPISPADSERIEILERALPASLSDEAAWAELTSREPRLAELEAHTRAGDYGFADDRVMEGPFLPDDPQERAQLSAEVARSRRLIADLKRLVGPPSKAADPVLLSRLAFGRAASYLQERKPAAPE